MNEEAIVQELIRNLSKSALASRILLRRNLGNSYFQLTEGARRVFLAIVPSDVRNIADYKERSRIRNALLFVSCVYSAYHNEKHCTNSCNHVAFEDVLARLYVRMPYAARKRQIVEHVLTLSSTDPSLYKGLRNLLRQAMMIDHTEIDVSALAHDLIHWDDLAMETPVKQKWMAAIALRVREASSCYANKR